MKGLLGPEFCLAPKIKLLPGLKSSLCLHLFGKLILTKIIKIVASRCQIIRLKCSKFDFGWGSAIPSSRI